MPWVWILAFYVPFAFLFSWFLGAFIKAGRRGPR